MAGKSDTARSSTKAATRTVVKTPRGRAPSRENKKALVGYFSPELNQAVHDIAAAEGVSMQSIIGEAVDLILRAKGRPAMNER